MSVAKLFALPPLAHEVSGLVLSCLVFLLEKNSSSSCKTPLRARPHPLWLMGIPLYFPAIFSKGDNFCYFPFTSLGTKLFQKRGLTGSGRIFLSTRKILKVPVTPL